MNTAFVKSVVATGTGIVASITASLHGLASIAFLAFLGVFLLTLAIEYGALKVKVIIPLLGFFGLVYYYFNSFGISIENILKIFGIA